MEWIILLVIGCFWYSYNKHKEKNVASKHVEIMFHNDYSYNLSAAKPEMSKNKSKGKWIEPNEEITIGKKTISKGLFYFGGVLKGDDYSGTDSSLIDDSLRIKEAKYTFTDSSLGYWPSFNGLSPMCRGAYIDWLASNRDMLDVPIGYLFIYFYGLERRIIKDYKKGTVGDKDCAEICAEILRLKRIFQDNYSFSGYSSRLLDYVAITYPDVFSLPDDEIKNSIYSNIFRVKLANVVQNNEPLSPELAYAWIVNHPDYNLRTPARRCHEEFKALFMRKYQESYPDGIIIKPNKTKLRLDYRPASPSLSYFQFGPTELCDPSVLSAPVKQLAKVALECTEELDAYSRYLGKQNTSRGDIDAVVLLPNALIEELGISLIKDFQLWAENIVVNEGGLCSFKDIWLQTQLPLPTKVNKKEQELICNLIEKSGYSFAPHPILHGNKLNTDDSIVLHKRDTTVQIENSAVFDDVAIKLRLGSIIANADLKIHNNEASFLQNIIHSNDNLTSQEKLSLDAYLKWLLNSPSSFNGLKASLSKLRDKDNEVVRKMLIKIALADGKIDPSEVKEIEKLYATLGLDKSTVPADIHALSSRRGGQVADTGTSSSLSRKKVPFKLDEGVLELHETETQAAQHILNKIFKDEDEDDTDNGKAQVEDPALENKALTIYKLISDREAIDREEFKKICSEHGFFVEAAIASINEWAFEKVNAPVIEDDTDIVIDREIADELKELGDI